MRLGAGGLLAFSSTPRSAPRAGTPATTGRPRSLPRAKSHHGLKPGGEILPFLNPLVERPGWPRGQGPAGSRSREPTALSPSRGSPLPRLLPKVASLINTFPLLPLLLTWPEAAQSFKKKKKGKRKENQVQGWPGGQGGCRSLLSGNPPCPGSPERTPCSDSQDLKGGGEHAVNCGPGPLPLVVLISTRASHPASHRPCNYRFLSWVLPGTRPRACSLHAL